MIKVFVSNISKLEDPKDNPALMERLSSYRKLKIEKCIQEKGRKQSLGAGLLLEQVLKQYGRSAEEIVRGENGKPEIDGFYFNLSHANDYVICAVADEPVGCDIEQVKAAPLRIAERYFTEKENEQLRNAVTSEEKSDLFYRMWTIKESYLKMTGEGLQVPLNCVEVILGDDIKIYRDGKPVDCVVKEFDVPGYKMSVCSKNSFEKIADFVELHYDIR